MLSAMQMASTDHLVGARSQLVMMAPTSLASLPTELLASLPEYLDNIEDYINLSSTCHTLHSAFALALPRTIFRLATNSSRIFFRPSPFFLVAATARELGNWARTSPQNEELLVSAFQQGIDGVLDLCLSQGCGLTMDRIRELHQLRFSTLNPVTDLIDKCVGTQWYSTPDFWNGGVDDAYTVDVDPPECLFHMAIYGELFAPDFDILLETASAASTAATTTTTTTTTTDGPPKIPLRLESRLEYIKYCIPDWACWACQTSGALDAAGNHPTTQSQVDPRRAVQPIGPYDPEAEKKHPGHQIGLRHLLRSKRWNGPWKRIRDGAGEGFAVVRGGGGDDGDDVEEEEEEDGYEQEDEDVYYESARKVGWKQVLWEAVSMYQGLDGMAAIARLIRADAKRASTLTDNEEEKITLPVEEQEQDEAWRRRLVGYRDLIDALPASHEAFGPVMVGRSKTYPFPCLTGDVDICVSGYVSGT